MEKIFKVSILLFAMTSHIDTGRPEVKRVPSNGIGTSLALRYACNKLIGTVAHMTSGDNVVSKCRRLIFKLLMVRQTTLRQEIRIN